MDVPANAQNFVLSFSKLSLNAASCYSEALEYERAGDLYLAEKEFQKAGENFKHAKQYRKAAQAYVNAGI